MPTVETPEGRLCSKCGERKPRSEFTPHSGCAGGLSRRCKTCAQKQHAEWREKNAEHVRKKGRETRENIYWRDPQAARLREKRLRFNLTAEQLSEMMVAQGARCLVCKNEFVNSFSNNAKPCIDHCHKSKKIRGILCNACNTALGMLKDNPDIADAAAAYLRKHAP
jgi:hypothetical protein